ncbi:hypothetical protein [Flavivirga jejuensis]|uniref:Lipoprotein n=1 Tax=Flavivirga jejuensis TaxID=870487 RepID=A0ABT8WPD1_9FLAO|nr:hypothetical protein [Flavivirga jejuensis]MDO5975022.1 hypothetical protein [Flavivirga jejuensis]
MNKIINIIVVIFILGYISCKKENRINFKEGSFKIVHDDSSVSHIIRDRNYQIKYFLDNPDEVQVFKINWKNKNKYVLEVLNKKISLILFP